MFDNIVLDLFVLGLIGIGIYAFLVLPRRRQFKQRVEYVETLETGIKVTTYGGIIGTVTSINNDGTATLEVAPGVELTIIATAIMGEYDPDAVSGSRQRALGQKPE